MVRTKNSRSIGGGSGEHIGRALSTRELVAAAGAVKAAVLTAADAAEREALKRVFAKLDQGAKWKATHGCSSGV